MDPEKKQIESVIEGLQKEINQSLQLVINERMRQLSKWGVRSLEYGDWLKILVEEVGELAEAMLDHEEEPHRVSILKEATQVAAVAVAIMEQCVYDRA